MIYYKLWLRTWFWIQVHLKVTDQGVRGIPDPVSDSDCRRFLRDFAAAAFLHDRNVLQSRDKSWEWSQRYWVVQGGGGWPWSQQNHSHFNMFSQSFLTHSDEAPLSAHSTQDEGYKTYVLFCFYCLFEAVMQWDCEAQWVSCSSVNTWMIMSAFILRREKVKPQCCS